MEVARDGKLHQMEFERGKPLEGDDLERFAGEVERLSAALEQIQVAHGKKTADAQEG